MQGDAGHLEEETRLRRLLFLKMRMKPSSRRIALVAHCCFEGAAIPRWTLKCLLRATVRRVEKLVGNVGKDRGAAGGDSTPSDEPEEPGTRRGGVGAGVGFGLREGLGRRGRRAVWKINRKQD